MQCIQCGKDIGQIPGHVCLQPTIDRYTEIDKLKAELAKCTKTMDDGTLAIKILKQENAALKVLVKDLLHYWKTATPTIDDLIERANDATKE